MTRATEKRTSIQVYESTKIDLVKIQGALQVKEGKKYSMERVIQILIEYWKKSPHD